MDLKASGLKVTVLQDDVAEFHPSQVRINWECRDPINYGSIESAAPEASFEVPYPGTYTVTRRSPLGVHQGHVTIKPKGQGGPKVEKPEEVNYVEPEEDDEDEVFDPGNYSVEEVVDFLSALDDEEAIATVKAAEADGKNRKTIADWEAPE